MIMMIMMTVVGGFFADAELFCCRIKNAITQHWKLGIK